MLENPTLSDEWEIIARHGNYGWGRFLIAAMLGVVGQAPEISASPKSVTLTVRHKSDGSVRTVTASNEREAENKINRGQFD
jgi:hypothetical protein